MLPLEKGVRRFILIYFSLFACLSGTDYQADLFLGDVVFEVFKEVSINHSFILTR